MPISVVFGGQFGSEGKGKVAHFFAKELNAKAVVRVGGPNSGHTVIDKNGNPLVLKQLPTSAILNGIYSVITAGNYINVDILNREIVETNIPEEYLYIDPYAVIISNEDIATEDNTGLKESIGSTGSGTGAAVSRRINRSNTLLFAKDIPGLSKYIRDTSSFLRHLLDEKERIVIEGTQGFGLSLLHSNYYPYTTSRDTSAAGFVSEAGISPLDVDEVIMVIRAFPIRVGGNSGILPLEIDWETVTKSSGSESNLIEFTSVTKKIRRVAQFDAEVVKRAIVVNNPTRIVLNHADYFDSAFQSGIPTEKVLLRVREIEKSINRKIDFIGYDRINLIDRNMFEYGTKFNRVDAKLL